MILLILEEQNKVALGERVLCPAVTGRLCQISENTGILTLIVFLCHGLFFGVEGYTQQSTKLLVIVLTYSYFKCSILEAHYKTPGCALLGN